MGGRGRCEREGGMERGTTTQARRPPPSLSLSLSRPHLLGRALQAVKPQVLHPLGEGVDADDADAGLREGKKDEVRCVCECVGGGDGSKQASKKKRSGGGLLRSASRRRLSSLVPGRRPPASRPTHSPDRATRGRSLDQTGNPGAGRRPNRGGCRGERRARRAPPWSSSPTESGATHARGRPLLGRRPWRRNVPTRAHVPTH